jgi:hypothetical protein
MPGLEQYAGMTMEEKVTVLLVKFDDLERNILAKPCPSPECVRCRADIAEMKVVYAKHLAESDNAISDLRDVEQEVGNISAWKSKREAELGKDEKIDEETHTRESWVVPLIVLGLIEAATFVISVGMWLSGK